MKTILALTFLAAGLSSARLPQAAPPTSNAPLRVMSFNLRYGTANDGPDRWEVRKDRLMSVLKKHHPDILGVQEALSFQIDEIRQAIPDYQSVGAGRDDGREKGEFSAILYDARRFQVLRSDTFWLSDTPSVPGSSTWGNANIRVCTWAYFKDRETGKFFYHFNTHLDHVSQPSREKSIAAIVAKLDGRMPKDPAFVTGDFNVGEDNPVSGILREAGYRDSFRLLHPDATDVGTFQGFKPTAGKDKIDYIWVGPGVSVRESAILKDKVDDHWPSDHFPVTATLDLG